MEHKSITADFVQVREGWLTTEPEFEGRFALVGGSGSESSEVRGSGAEFVPQEAGGITCKSHCTCLPEDRPVEALRSSILRRRIGGCPLVLDAISLAPVVHGVGDQLAVICHKNF